MISAEISLYPMETTGSDDIINQSLNALAEAGLNYDVGPLSTKIEGEPNTVWDGLKNLFERAQSQDTEVAMVITIANSRI